MKLTITHYTHPDLLFLQGLLDILPFASDDLAARNAIWDIISRLLAQVQDGETSPSNLHQYISILASKSDLIEEELLDHQLAASNKDQESSTASGRNLRLRTAAVSFITLIKKCSIYTQLLYCCKVKKIFDLLRSNQPLKFEIGSCFWLQRSQYSLFCFFNGWIFLKFCFPWLYVTAQKDWLYCKSMAGLKGSE